MEIGDNVFVTDAKTKGVYQAIIVGMNISQTGYLLISVINDKDERTTVESVHVHKTQSQAEVFISEKTKTIDYAEHVMSETKDTLDKLRIEVIGEPSFKNLAKRIIGDNK